MMIGARLRSLWRNLTGNSRQERELAAELRAYLELLTDARVENGVNLKEAERQALIEIGGLEQVKERVREARMGHLLETILQDVRYAIRVLAKSRGFSVVALLTLALCVGANSAIFSVVNGVLLRPLPFDQPDRLARVYATLAGGMAKVTSRKDFSDWRDQNQVFDQLEVYAFDGRNLTGNGEPARVDAVDVSAGFFQMFRVAPILGRTFSEIECLPGAGNVVLLGESFWKQHFGGDPKVVGRPLTIDGVDTTVVGIVPDKFDDVIEHAGMWFPFINIDEDRGDRDYWAVGRLKAGVSLKQASAEMAAISERLEQLHKDSNFRWGATVVGLRESIVGDVRLMLLVLLAAAALVLLIGCVNIANLLLARAAARWQEVAIRSALGAGRARMLRQLLTESLVLSGLGAGLGVLLCLATMKPLVILCTDNLPRAGEIRMDGRVLALAAVLSIVTALVFGLAPGSRLAGSRLNEALKEGGRGNRGGRHQNRVRSLLVVSELAISLTLLIGCGLLMRSFHRLRSVSPGFDTHDLLTARIPLPEAKYKTPQSRMLFGAQLLRQLNSSPETGSAALCTTLPLGGNGWEPWTDIVPAGHPFTPEETIETQYRLVSLDYFRTMRIPVIEGRTFDRMDGVTAHQIVVLSQSMARKLWPNEDPIGKQILFQPTYAADVIGVVGDLKLHGLDSPDDMAIYTPVAQNPPDVLTLVARKSSKEANLAARIKDVVKSIDKDLPVDRMRTMDEIRSRTLEQRTFNLVLLSLFAGVALVLAAIGTYGVIAYSVAERGQEIGVRMALGALRRDVLLGVVGRAVSLSFVGITVGLLSS
ncbi:MAG TPA: ABC transporter permease, partial [Blastocatellia bacterium]|nr:ABC transporter permease [Blastocatellia bacterium]